MDSRVDGLEIINLNLSQPELYVEEPARRSKRRRHWVKVPCLWLEALTGASGQVYALALHLLYRVWRNGGEPVKLGNGDLKIDGISASAKRRALNELERRGLVKVERRPKRSPVVRLLLSNSARSG
jgi:hypothetical protein